MNSSRDITVLVVDDQRLIREGIASLLDIQAGVRVVGTAVDGQEALSRAAELNPDVVLMDVRMPVLDGISATERLKQQRPDCQVLMLTTFDDDEYVVKSMRAGASGYLLKDIPAADLAQAIRLAHAGIYQLDETVAGKLLGAVFQSRSVMGEGGGTAVTPLPTPPAIPHDLTDRELDVLRLIAKGATNREIAAQLVVSEGTVKNHVSSILSRLGLRDRVQAALYAHEHGLVD
jgi:DNA-binding NarL/FixJ family response regulator